MNRANDQPHSSFNIHHSIFEIPTALCPLPSFFIRYSLFLIRYSKFPLPSALLRNSLFFIRYSPFSPHSSFAIRHSPSHSSFNIHHPIFNIPRSPAAPCTSECSAASGTPSPDTPPRPKQPEVRAGAKKPQRGGSKIAQGAALGRWCKRHQKSPNGATLRPDPKRSSIR